MGHEYLTYTLILDMYFLPICVFYRHVFFTDILDPYVVFIFATLNCMPLDLLYAFCLMGYLLLDKFFYYFMKVAFKVQSLDFILYNFIKLFPKFAH